MSKLLDVSLVWYRNDLRVKDHIGLTKAIDSNRQVVAYYNFNPELFKLSNWGFKRTDRFRSKFLIESVIELQKELKKLNISLIIDNRSDERNLLEIIKKLNVKEIFVQREWTRDEVNEENKIFDKFNSNIKVNYSFDQFLYHPNDLKKKIDDIPNVFTLFRKKCEKDLKVRTLKDNPRKLESKNRLPMEYKIPSLNQLGFKDFNVDKRSSFPFKGGTKSGIERVNNYFWETKKLSFYKNTRNGLIGIDYSSKLSSWLANGSLSPKMIYWEIKKYENQVIRNQSTYWLVFELIWRDYFKYISMKYRDKIFNIKGILNRKYNWNNSKNDVSDWVNGKTKESFVNSNMLELKNTGWMSNRGRQNVASYFSKELKLDWRIGAAYFESMLIDYDVHSNYGNWMYVSGVGNDPRDRKFNVKWQSEKYDPNMKYQNLWLNG
ncbi:MAG: DASH family cryptochrome [Flavobacteriaceae bacterium]|nr:deoxyribodipyrimidine photolyase [Flavobacteriaceae bacterium]|tara:strand:- start:706 stop:2007 length:1302 start_codon:yes stop_codon:yes gene_type:complete